MNLGELESSRLESRGRFDALANFVRLSDSISPQGDVDYRGAIYSSWVLLAYAATEAGIVGLGRAVLRLLGRISPMPNMLPASILGEHRIRSLKHLARLVEDETQQAEFAAAFRGFDAQGWHERSRLMHVDHNVWPDTVRELLGRLHVPSGSLSWMNEAETGGSETLSSRVAELIRERNALAHGGRPDNLLSSELMCQRVGDALRYVEQAAITLQCHLSDLLTLAPVGIGQVDHALQLGTHTVPVVRLDFAISVGDHLLIGGISTGTKSCIVQSLQCDGQALTRAPAGAERVSITVSREIHGGTLCLPI